MYGAEPAEPPKWSLLAAASMERKKKALQHLSGAMANLIGVFAEFERDLIRERVGAGLENARCKGKCPGRRPFFDIASLGTLGRLRDRGMSVRAIAREMKVSKSLVHKSLKNMKAQTQDNQGSREAEETVHE